MDKEYIKRKTLLDEIKSLQVIVTGLRTGKGILNEYAKHYKNSVMRIIDEQATADVREVIHGKWELYDEHEDEYEHHRCSICKEDAIFTYEMESMYDEDFDGEWRYVTDICAGIDEYLTEFCPHCGAKMDGK